MPQTPVSAEQHETAVIIENNADIGRSDLIDQQRPLFDVAEMLIHLADSMFSIAS